MLNENDIVDAVADYLGDHGYDVLEKRTTTQRGIDIVAKDRSTRRFLLVEAKGATSDRNGSSRHEEGFSTAQVRTHVARAFYAAVAALQHPDYPNALAAIAFPNLEGHRERVSAIKTALDRLGILVFLVNKDRKVELQAARTHP